MIDLPQKKEIYIDFILYKFFINFGCMVVWLYGCIVETQHNTTQPSRSK